MFPIAKASRIRRALTLKTGQTVVYATGDNGTYQVGESHRYTSLTTGQYSGNTNITMNAKTDIHANTCVYDETTSLMWSRNPSASVGPSSNGSMPWTTNVNGEGIFAYVAAANAAALSGYSDWRIPTDAELFGLRKMGGGAAYPDTNYFPALGTLIWSSTTQPNSTTSAMYLNFNQGTCAPVLKTSSSQLAMLVRGPT